MKKNNFTITDHDYYCLMALWKWKLLTTNALSVLVYKGRSLERCYKCLLRLEKQECIVSTSSWDRKSVVWHLGKMGWEIISTEMGDKILQNGFRSENKDHDFWVSAIHLGEWISAVPDQCDLFSEQELRRTNFESYPDWVPQTKEHRPDGYWKIGIGKPNEESLIALEVELSKKTPLAYSDVGDFYSNTISPYQVIWVVKSQSDISYILSHIKNGSSTQGAEQSFITLDQYTKSQWQSQIIVGKNKGKSLLDILGTSVAQGSHQCVANVLLNVRKKPIESTIPREIVKLNLGLSRQY